MHIRRRLSRYIKHKIFKVSEGEILPKILIVINCILFPIRGIVYWQQKRFGYDFETDTFCINKNRYSTQIFGNFERRNIGKVFIFKKLENGIITLEWIDNYYTIKEER